MAIKQAVVGSWSDAASILMLNTGSQDVVAPDKQILTYINLAPHFTGQ